MVAISSSFFTVPDRHPALGGPDPELVVWLRGEHDVSNQDALCLTLARAIALGGPGLVLDLSEVRTMSTSTLEVIVRAREYLRRRSASLTVRSPSARVRRLIDACGLNDLLGPEAEAAAGGAGGAGGHWAYVPAAEPYDLHPSQPAAVPRRAPRRSVKGRV
jgi:anti-anti-sigma factor